MSDFPAISVEEEHFAIVDGFLVGFCSKESSRSSLWNRISSEAREKVRCFVCRYKPDTVLRLQLMSSNYFIMGNNILFDLVEEKYHVNFVKNKGRYYCRKTSPKTATHIALKIATQARKTPQCSKYIVCETPLTQRASSFLPLLRQQSEDLASIGKKEIERSFNLLASKGDSQSLDVEFLDQDELMECRKKSVKTSIVQQEAVDMEVEKMRRLARESLQSVVLKFCERRSTCKLEKMKEVLLEVPSFNNHAFEMEAFYEQSKARAMQNLSLASGRVFMPVLDLIAKTDFGKYDTISDRFVVVDQLLIDVPSKMVLNPLGQRFLKTATMDEKTKLLDHELLNWDKIRGEREPLKVRSAKLLDIKGFPSDKERLETGSLSQETTVVTASIVLTRYEFKLNFEDLGLKQVVVETLGNAGVAAHSTEDTSTERTERLKLRRPHLGYLSPSDLLQRFQQFCTYEEQLNLYLEILGSMIGRKLT